MRSTETPGTGTQKLFCCSKCDSEFSNKELLKKHETTHTGGKHFSCRQCDSKFSSLDKMKEHNRSHTCPFFLQKTCRFGPSGRNQNGVCSYNHPRICIFFQTTGQCKKGDNCDFFHEPNGNGPNPSAARPAARDFRPGKGPLSEKAFLGEGRFQADLFQFLDQYFQQRMGQDLNGNRMRGPQQWR